MLDLLGVTFFLSVKMHVPALTHSSSGVLMMKLLSSKLIKSRRAPALTSVATIQWTSSGESVLYFISSNLV